MHSATSTTTTIYERHHKVKTKRRENGPTWGMLTLLNFYMALERRDLRHRKTLSPVVCSNEDDDAGGTHWIRHYRRFIPKLHNRKKGDAVHHTGAGSIYAHVDRGRRKTHFAELLPWRIPKFARLYFTPNMTVTERMSKKEGWFLHLTSTLGNHSHSILLKDHQTGFVLGNLQRDMIRSHTEYAMERSFCIVRKKPLLNNQFIVAALLLSHGAVYEADTKCKYFQILSTSARPAWSQMQTKQVTLFQQSVVV